MYYKIFTNCFIVNGYSQSLIYDLQREKIIPIANDIAVSLKKYDGKKIDKLFLGKENSKYKYLKDFIGFLEKENVIYLSKNKIINNRFPKINLEYHEPSILSNIIITFFKKDDICLFFEKIINIVNITHCKFIQIRIEKNISKKELIQILKYFDNTIIKHISILIDSTDCINFEFNKIINQFPRILNVIIYNYNKNIKFITDKKYGHIEFIKYSDSDFPLFKELNKLRFLYMKPNIISYSESQTKNLYYNKKIYIESNGYLYNSPFSNKQRGNIFKNDIISIIDKKDFNEYWNITKNEIETCNVCQYRFVCIDGRIPIKKNEMYYFDSKCEYNPKDNTFNDK